MFDITAYYILIAAIGLVQIQIYWVLLGWGMGYWLEWVGLGETKASAKLNDMFAGRGGYFAIVTLLSVIYNILLFVGWNKLVGRGDDDPSRVFYTVTANMSKAIVEFAGGWIVFIVAFVVFSLFVRKYSEKFIKLSEKWGDL